MREKYYASIYCEASMDCEVIAEDSEDAKKKAWEVAMEKIPGAEHPYIYVESDTERREQEEYKEFLEWKRNKEEQENKK